MNNDGGFRLDNLKYIDEKFFTALKKGAIKENDILIVKDGATTGKVSYVDSDFPFERAAINEHLFSLTVDTAVAHPRYVFGFLKSPQGQKEILKDFRGAAIGGISRGFVDLAKIPFPPLDDQIRIAHLLGKVEGLIAQRKQHLQQLDDLLKSMFLEMFGDPVGNVKGWGKTQFSELLDGIESGKSPKCETRQAESDEWGVLKLGAVTRCKFDETENKALPNDVAPSVRDEVKAGDLLFSRKNTYELVAACAYVFSTRQKLLMPDLIFRFVFKQGAEINPIFMWQLLTCDSQRKAIQSLATGAAGTMPNISKANLKTVLLPIPPLHLQNKFAVIVEKVESIKSRYQQSLIDLEALYGALSQQAFKGELDLSRVPLPSQADETPVQTEQANSEPTTPASFQLPEPEASDWLSVENRPKLFEFWLNAWCERYAEESFTASKFLDAASQRLVELSERDAFQFDKPGKGFDEAKWYEEPAPFGINEYEQIKKWVFEALASGKLTQGFDDADNRIQLKAVQA